MSLKDADEVEMSLVPSHVYNALAHLRQDAYGLLGDIERAFPDEAPDADIFDPIHVVRKELARILKHAAERIERGQQ